MTGLVCSQEHLIGLSKLDSTDFSVVRLRGRFQYNNYPKRTLITSAEISAASLRHYGRPERFSFSCFGRLCQAKEKMPMDGLWYTLVHLTIVIQTEVGD